MIEIDIDGQKIEIEQGSMIIEAADRANIHIPRFCYHKKLSIAANCRMCLVDVDKIEKPVPACSTPVTDGMKIKTLSDKAKQAQRGVMEFLLINHPLDCPICDQGGECELQDVALTYGKDISRFSEAKRVVKDQDLGSLIATNMTRCIHCTRCIRFGQEIAGLRELGATGRGDKMEIGTYVSHAMRSELSGNIIDVCPVGALTSKPYAFKARAWEMQQVAAISPHDCLGSHMYVHKRRNEVMRVVPKENNELNEVWLSDRDRFSYLGLASEDRLKFPLVKQNGLWRKSDWHSALNEVVARLQNIVVQYGADQIGGIISPNASVEECYLFQKVLRGLGCNNIDHRVRELDTRDQHLQPLAPQFDLSLPALREQNVIMLVGSNIRHEQPLLGIRLFKATRRVDTKILCLNPHDYEFQFPVAQKTICALEQMPKHLAAIVKVLAEQCQFKLDANISTILKDVQPSAMDSAMAQQLIAGGEKVVILLGAQALHHPNAASLRQLTQCLSQIIPAKITYLTTGANSAGAWLAGAIPHRGAAGKQLAEMGLSVAEQFTQPRKAYILWGIEPELDCANSGAGLAALNHAEYVVSFNPFLADAVRHYANMILPIAAFAETEGSYVNLKGDWQSFNAAVTPAAEVKPGWKVLRVLGNLLHLEGFDYQTQEQVRDELKIQVDKHTFTLSKETLSLSLNNSDATHKVKDNELQRLCEWPIYKMDALLRRAHALQRSALGEEVASLSLHPDDAKRLGFKQGEWITVSQADVSIQLALTISAQVAVGQAYIPAGLDETVALGYSSGTVHLTRGEQHD